MQALIRSLRRGLRARSFALPALVLGMPAIATAQLAAAGASSSLPAPPTSVAPVVDFEYDAAGNPRKHTLAKGVAGFGFATVHTYDKLNRIKTTDDARLGRTEFGHDGQDGLVSVKDPRQLLTQSPRTGLGDVRQLLSPDTGTASQTFDAAGNLKTRTDSRGVLASYSHDELNRLTSVVYTKPGQASQSFTWSYDQTGAGFGNGIGRLTTTTHPAGSTTFSYDAHGKVLSETQTLNAATGANTAAITTTVAYAYDAAGRLASITYPSGRKLSYAHVAGRLSGVSLAPSASLRGVPLVSRIEHEPFGAVRGWSWHMHGGLVPHPRVFDSHGRPVRYRIGDHVRDLRYDAADRISSYTHYAATGGAATPALDQVFGYDELGRLSSVVAGASTWSIGYDANGNRTFVTHNGVHRTYTTSATSNRLQSLSNPARAFTYDAAGNTTASSYTATYDLRGRMASLTASGVVTRYAVDGEGRRLRKYSSTGAASARLFVHSTQGHLLGEYDAAGNPLVEYFWLGSVPLAVAYGAPAGDDVKFIHTDHLGAPRALLDRTQQLRWRWLAEPFGTTAAESNPAGLGNVTLNLRFPGQYFDQESGLHYNFHRDYDPAVGRYSQSDPIGLDGGINTYSYALNQPTSYVDPDGRLVFIPAVVWWGGAAVGAAGWAMWAASPDGKNAVQNAAASATKAECKPECDAAASRSEAMVAAYSWAGISIGGAGANPIPWSNFNMSAGMTRGGREYGEFMRTYYPKNYGYSTPAGASVVEHPFGHPDQPGPAHHACPHFHAKNSAGVEQIFAYKPGS